MRCGEDRCWIVTCRARTDNTQTHKHTNKIATDESDKIITIEKVAIANHWNLNAVRRRAGRTMPRIQQPTNSILLQPFDSATQMSSQVRIFWRLISIYQYSGLDIFWLCIRKNCCFHSCGKNLYIAVRFRDPDFLKESNNLATRRCFQVFFYCTNRKCAIFLFPVYLT